MSQGARLLLVEDDPDLAAGLYDFLADCGYRMDAAPDGATALRLAAREPYDALVLDLLLPGMDGRTLCRRLREELGQDVPVLMLTALDSLEDKLDGFDAGADDYLVKPVEPEELAARLKALLRRARGGGGQELCVGDLRFNPRTLEVSRAGRPLRLNARCRQLLEVLLRASPETVSRETLEAALWGEEPPESGSLRTHIYLLRQAVDEPFATPLIHTVHGHGYRLATPD